MRRQTVHRDVITGITTFRLVEDNGCVRFLDNGLEKASRSEQTFTIHDDDPLSARQETRWELTFRRDDWHVRVETESTLTADAAHFYVTNRVEGYEGQVRVFAKSWTEKIARDHI